MKFHETTFDDYITEHNRIDFLKNQVNSISRVYVKYERSVSK